MKRPKPREQLLIAATILVIVVIVFIGSLQRLHQAAAQHAVLQDGSERAVSLAREIIQLRAAPARALEIAPQDLNPAAMIAEATTHAGIPVTAKRIETTQPRPLAGGDSSTVETSVLLNGLTMKQTVDLLLYIKKNHPAWTVKSLRLLASSTDKNLWNVNCTLLTTLYVPGTPKGSSNETR